MSVDRELRVLLEYMFENMDYCVARMAIHFMSEREIKQVIRTGVSKLCFSRIAYEDGVKQLKLIRPYFYTGKSELAVPAMLCRHYLKTIDVKDVTINEGVLRKYRFSCVGSLAKGKKCVHCTMDFKKWSKDTHISPEKLGAAYVAYLFETKPQLRQLADEAVPDVPELPNVSSDIAELWQKFNKAYNCFCFATGQFMLNGTSTEFVPYMTVANSYVSLLEDLIGYHSMNKPCMHLTFPCIDEALEEVGLLLEAVSLNTLDGSIDTTNKVIAQLSECENLEHKLQQGLITLYMLYRVWKFSYRMTDAYSNASVFWVLYEADSFFGALAYGIKEFAPDVYDAINAYFRETRDAGLSVQIRASFKYIKTIAEIVERCNKLVTDSGFVPFFDVSELDRLIEVSDDEDSYPVEYTAFVERVRCHLMLDGIGNTADVVYGLGLEARKLRNKIRASAPAVLSLAEAQAFLTNSHMKGESIGLWGKGASGAAATLTKLSTGATVSQSELKGVEGALVESARMTMGTNLSLSVAKSECEFIIKSRKAQQERIAKLKRGVSVAKNSTLKGNMDKLYSEAVQYMYDVQTSKADKSANVSGSTDTAKSVVKTNEEDVDMKAKEKASDIKGSKKPETADTKAVQTTVGSEENVKNVESNHFDLFSEIAQPWTVYELGWLLGFDSEEDMRDILTELPNHSYNSCLQKLETLHNLGIRTQADLRRYLKSNGQN